MKELQKELATGKFHTIYLFYGEEAYLKKDYKKKLKDACIDKEDTINFNQYEGKSVNPKEIIDLSQTLPFFAEHRLILLENTGFFKKSCDELAEYVPEIPETSILLFVEDEVDKRTKFYKAVKKYGRVVEFARQNEKILEKWVLGKIKKKIVRLHREHFICFLKKPGIDMENIASELEKLLCYTMNKTDITGDDVSQICTEQTSNRIFDMIKAIALKKQKEALDLYYDLLTLKEPPLRILALLSRQFRLLYEVKNLAALNKTKDEIAKLTGLHSFIVNQYISQARGFKNSVLKESLRDCLNVEEEIKKGIIADKLGVELLIVKYSK